jgi:hypothetical protein
MLMAPIAPVIKASAYMVDKSLGDVQWCAVFSTVLYCLLHHDVWRVTDTEPEYILALLSLN